MNDTIQRDIIGDFRLLQQLRVGGAGVVHLATPITEKPYAKPGDPLAIKIFDASYVQRDSNADRLKREYRIGVDINDPNLVRIYDYVVGSRTSHSYLIMEYIDGLSLDTWLGLYYPIPPRLLLNIISQLISAIKVLHNKGIMHRDIKPSNIMLSSTFNTTLLDYGIEKSKHDTTVTPEGTIIGTYRNSSPELLLGNDYNYCC